MDNKRLQLIILILLAILAFAFRIYHLDAPSISDDEAHKIQAARMYRHCDFSFNLEHPMLMKSLITITLIIAEKWNSTIGSNHPSLSISYETITRFPNVLFGALTTIVLYLLALELFDRKIALLTAALWATGLNAMAVNRIAKEDTLLVFFTWLGFYFFCKAKFLGPVETPQRVRLYILSGVSFGLMLASKYFPHYFGLNWLYHYTRKHEPQRNYRLGNDVIGKLFAGLIIAFIIANPALFLPSSIHYLFFYTSGETVVHHGYEMMKNLYYNNFWKLENPTPAYFYLLFMAVKIPPVLLLFFIAGLYIIIKGPKNDGYYFLKFMLILWIIPYSLVASKWLRYTLSLMPMIYMTAAIAIIKFYDMIKNSTWRQFPGAKIAPLLIVLLVLSFAWNAFANSPYYMLYVNIFGGGNAYRAYYFPHDEIYDTGIRESVEFIATKAPPNSTIASDAPDAVAFYIHHFQRNDLKIAELSNPSFISLWNSADSNTIYVIDQRGRRYFSNAKQRELVQKTSQPIKIMKIDGVTTSLIYIK
ncbi:MAG: hypothetical protein A2Y62_15775 [Candidatus Fischerbacteria bacterium RBG_13_37_8]|uniref:ArnT-like N-terminal domain-containing protein n=1 Tax=Candidatus Fischerbacteria bacterium RBG_13_37_8 TaxID=1817863 RepID=A0A1F5VVW9_9BACT|nr:MAG: hypothetical protein A2Y62_15775 [Candidatus Fischerbacteria bacterium RBG_13_37_8]